MFGIYLFKYLKIIYYIKMKKYLLRELYHNYIKKQLTKSCCDDYLTKPFSTTDVPNQVASFLANDEPIYAYTILDKECKDKVGNQSSWWKKYYEFIRLVVRKEVKDAVEESKIKVQENVINDLRKSLQEYGLHKFDGMQPLIDAIGEEAFIHLAINNSYFFSPKIVKDRHYKIIDYICNNNSEAYRAEYIRESEFEKRKKQNEGIPARNTNTKEGENSGKHENGEYVDENNIKICKVVEDGNGNAKVCSIIRFYTGYYLNQTLEKKPFKNYIISHIWGRAIDPRFFTNFWNIVLVPAWANHLLDKDEASGTLASKLKQTIMAINNKLYNNKCTDWNKISLSGFPKYNPKDVLSGCYEINVIQKKTKGEEYGKITKETVNL